MSGLNDFGSVGAHGAAGAGVVLAVAALGVHEMFPSMAGRPCLGCSATSCRSGGWCIASPVRATFTRLEKMARSGHVLARARSGRSKARRGTRFGVLATIKAAVAGPADQSAMAFQPHCLGTAAVACLSLMRLAAVRVSVC